MEDLVNVLSVDVEDWFNVLNMAGHVPRETWKDQELRVLGNTRRILDLLDRRKTTATFFVLGWVAERLPELAPEIRERGHEVGTHGYSHQPLTDLTPESFARDLDKALEVLHDQGIDEVLGFRAPSFTITPRTAWAFDVLKSRGLKYDSSVFPVSFHPDYGMPDAPLDIHRTESGIIEVPMSVASLYGRNVPCSGGGYFRLFPYALTRALIRSCNRQGRPVVFYVHPWEIDPEQPKVPLPLLKRFRHYNNLGKTLERLERLLGDFRFSSAYEVVKRWEQN